MAIMCNKKKKIIVTFVTSQKLFFKYNLLCFGHAVATPE